MTIRDPRHQPGLHFQALRSELEQRVEALRQLSGGSRRDLVELAEHLLALGEHPLDGSRVGCVPEDDAVAPLPLDRRLDDRRLRRKLRPILPEADDPCPLSHHARRGARIPKLPHVTGVSRPEPLRQEHGQRTADHLLPGVAEDRLGTAIE